MHPDNHLVHAEQTHRPFTNFLTVACVCPVTTDVPLLDRFARMRFNTYSLIELTTLTAVFLACFRVNTVIALVIVSGYVCIRYLVRDIECKRTANRRLVRTGAAAASGGILFYGLSSIVTWALYAKATGTYPEPDEFDLSLPGYMLAFSIVYGGSAAICGALLGLLAGLWFTLRAQLMS